LTPADHSVEHDLKSLEKAYASPSGIVVENDTAYLAGTRSISDVAEWPALPWTGRYTTRYRDAQSIPSNVSRFVGHSLGASVAKSLAEDRHGRSVCYGSPTTCDEGHSNYGDPVTWFQGVSGLWSGGHRAAVGHGLSAYSDKG